ncbi:hypothetical protein DE146DRAFT_621218 [Phaeosphaeria sp. MPI-PUGE-AT-0046c]|nr:hypothetical protein DE146DRAFT_621218 [Phaeosphaeria sp. MPI-PUGE-AT-0046c]
MPVALGGCFSRFDFREQLHDRSLSNTSRTDRRFLEQWGRVCHRLAEHVVPDQLSLYIVGHVESRRVAEQVLQPLYQLPTLCNSGICLGPSSHPYRDELRNIATTAVNRLTCKAVPVLSQTFPFLNLPRELQLQILADSPLVQDTCIRIENGGLARYGLTHSSMADLATYVFFSQNAFSIYTWNPSLGWSDQGNLRGMHSFLARLPSHALRRIRRLTIWLPPIDSISLPYNHPDWPLWLASVELLSTKATLSGLALTIQVGNYRVKRDRLARKIHFTPQDQAQILRAYEEDIVYPLVQLQGLKLLFLHVPCPFGRGNEEARVQVERKLEQIVMGSDYKSYSMGKSPPNGYTRPFLLEDD